MKLSPAQIDALTELMNIATGRAAASLAGILHQPVRMRVMEVWALDQAEARIILKSEIGEVGSVVEQRFSGGLTGNSLMVMTSQSANELVQILLQQNCELANLTSTELTVLTEVGNIILNACVSTFAIQTGRRLHFSLPHVTLNALGAHLILDLTSTWEAPFEGLLMKSHLLVGKTETTIYILILMTMNAGTLHILVDKAINRLSGTQG